jgi:hypothetical protein
MRIENPEVDKLVELLVEMTGESPSEIVRRALAELHQRLALHVGQQERGRNFLRFLEEEVWPTPRQGQLGRRLSREEEEDILGVK